MTPVWVCRVQGAVCEASYFSASTSLTSSQSTEDALPIMEINQSRRKSLLRSAERTLIASLCASPTDTHDAFPHQNTHMHTNTHKCHLSVCEQRAICLSTKAHACTECISCCVERTAKYSYPLIPISKSEMPTRSSASRSLQKEKQQIGCEVMFFSVTTVNGVRKGCPLS